MGSKLMVCLGLFIFLYIYRASSLCIPYFVSVLHLISQAGWNEVTFVSCLYMRRCSSTRWYGVKSLHSVA